MNVIDYIEAELPYLRRYARAVTGQAKDGDKQVERVLAELLNLGPNEIIKRALFQHLDRLLASLESEKSGVDEFGEIVQVLQSDARRALLLTYMESFSEAETAAIMGISKSAVTQLIVDAEACLASMMRSRIMIIEDETLIAASLSQIAVSLGHEVVGQAATSESAIKLAMATQPDLILADVKLADGSLGTDAVASINETSETPVIFITAYPEKLLTGEGTEPAYLIPKPFKNKMVKAVISQALFVKLYAKK